MHEQKDQIAKNAMMQMKQQPETETPKIKNAFILTKQIDERER
jgi:hypothetical protein